jgi:cation transport ATPase
MEKESSAEKQQPESDSAQKDQKKEKKKDPVKESFREVSALGVKVMTLMAVLLFFIQMMTGILWQVALMRSVTAYIILLIVYYLSILFITIIKRNSPDKKGEATQSQ